MIVSAVNEGVLSRSDCSTAVTTNDVNIQIAFTTSLCRVGISMLALRLRFDPASFGTDGFGLLAVGHITRPHTCEDPVQRTTCIDQLPLQSQQLHEYVHNGDLGGSEGTFRH